MVGLTVSEVNSSQIHTSPQKTHLHATSLVPCGLYSVFHWLLTCYNNRLTSLNLCWLGLGGGTGKNLCRPACKFDLHRYGRKWSQDPGPGLASTGKFLTCGSVWLGRNTVWSRVKGSVSLGDNRKKKRDHYAKKTPNCSLIQKPSRHQGGDWAPVACKDVVRKVVYGSTLVKVSFYRERNKPAQRNQPKQRTRLTWVNPELPTKKYGKLPLGSRHKKTARLRSHNIVRKQWPILIDSVFLLYLTLYPAEILNTSSAQKRNNRFVLLLIAIARVSWKCS